MLSNEDRDMMEKSLPISPSWPHLNSVSKNWLLLNSPKKSSRVQPNSLACPRSRASPQADKELRTALGLRFTRQTLLGHVEAGQTQKMEAGECGVQVPLPNSLSHT